MPFNLSVRCASIMLVAALLGTSGCGPGLLPVNGKLVWDDGKPVSGANVRFVPVSGSEDGAAVGQTDKDGSFTLVASGGANGVRPGDYKVVVSKGPATSAPAGIKGEP